MGRRGPARRPTALRLVEGARPDKVNQDEPQPLPVEPDAPEEWTELGEASEQLQVWNRVVDQLRDMGILFAADTDSLVAYVEAVVIHRQASRQLDGANLLVTGAQGNLVKNPLLQIQRDAAAVIRAFAREFGLTPSARASVKAEKGDKGDAENPFAPTAGG